MSFPFNVYFAALLGSALTTVLTLPLWRKWCLRTGVVDDPGERKIHNTTIPLAGGLAVMTGLLLPLLLGIGITFYNQYPDYVGMSSFLQTHPLHNHPLALQEMKYGITHRALQLTAIFVGAIGMLFLGLRDDKVELRPAVKFTGQLIIALIVAASGVRITLFVHSLLFSYAITVLWIITVVNAFNFMDNMNGLCAGLAIIGAMYFGIFTATAGQYLVATIAFLTAGALVGFLPWNFPKATAFLGDGGSHLIGYLMAVLAILPHFYTPKHPQTIAVLTPLLFLAVPLLDLACVVIIRWRRGKPFYIGDTNHLSHRLVRRGWGKVRAVLFIWALAAALGSVAFL